MTTNLIADLEEFTREMSKHDERQVIKNKPESPHPEIMNLRVTLIEEEVHETIDAMYELNGVVSHQEGYYASERAKELLAEVADGIADSIVVLIGTALAYGIPLQKVWDEVHRSNMDKVTRIRVNTHNESDFIGGREPLPDIKKRPDGKILKPEDWQPPKIREIIEETMK